MQTGLLPFILNMLKADPATLARADVAKLAAKYAIPEATARGYLQLHITKGDLA